MRTTSLSHKISKTTFQFWDSKRNIIRSKKGGAIIGEGIVTSHGYSILDELVGNTTYFQVLILNVTGHLPKRNLADWVEATFVCLSWPDPRIWCNFIGSLGGTSKTSPVAAVVAGILASDSKLYGPGTMIGATAFIANALKLKKQGCTVDSIINQYSRRSGVKPIIPGFARPLAYGDERVTAMERVREQLGFGMGEHLSLAFEVQEILLQNFGESINLSGYMMAFLSDQGMSANEIYRLYSLCVNNGIHACYAEAYDSPPESFLPLRCDDIDYQGKPSRQVPKKKYNT